jgi:hypothetical protein
MRLARAGPSRTRASIPAGQAMTPLPDSDSEAYQASTPPAALHCSKAQALRSRASVAARCSALRRSSLASISLTSRSQYAHSCWQARHGNRAAPAPRRAPRQACALALDARRRGTFALPILPTSGRQPGPWPPRCCIPSPKSVSLNVLVRFILSYKVSPQMYVQPAGSRGSPGPCLGRLGGPPRGPPRGPRQFQKRRY